MDPEREGIDKGFEDTTTEHEVDDRVSTEYVKDEEDKEAQPPVEQKEGE